MLFISCDEKPKTTSKLIDEDSYEGYAVLIGVNDPDVIHYGNDKTVCGTKKNVIGINSLLSKTLFKRKNIYRLHNDSTKWDTVVSILERIRSTIDHSKNNYVFVYFSGHGSALDVTEEISTNCPGSTYPQIKNKTAQFLCFFDRMVLKTEVLKQLALFRKKTKIYFLIDACHSGSNKESSASPDHSTAQTLQKYYCSTYRKVLIESIDYKFDGKADVCITAAASSLGTTSSGLGCNQTEFTAAYCSQWGKNKPGNYKSFGKTEFYNDHSFFLNTYPLIF